jgi:predicted NUDIX family NTP pyrophosphohydrolase
VRKNWIFAHHVSKKRWHCRVPKDAGNDRGFARSPGRSLLAQQDIGAWSIPKGEYGIGENPEEVARREFLEELGIEMTNEVFPLGEVRQRGGKTVTAFATEIDVDVRTIRSNMFEIEWPPRSGRRQVFPEVDRAQWFDLATARSKIVEGQKSLVDRLEAGFGKATKR